MQENTIGATTSRSSAGCSTSSTSNCNGNGNGNIVVFDSSMFAPLSGLSVSPSISQPRSSFSSLVTNVPINSDHSNKPALSLSPLYQFSANAAPVQQQAPTMSATALLQKAAQMGAAAAGSSLLCGGFGLAVSSSSSPPEQVKPENGSPSPSRGAGEEHIELGLPSGSGGSGLMLMGDPSGFFGSKPMTLDLLGLGIGPEGSSASAFPSYLTSMAGGPLDDATAFTAGSSSNSELKGSWDWDGQATPEKA